MTSTGPESPAAAPAPPSAAPAWRRPGSLALFLGLFLVILAADLWLKEWSFRHVAGFPVVLPEAPRPGLEDPNYYIAPHPPRVLVPRLLNLRLTFNTGAVFGLGRGMQAFFVIVSVIAAGAIVWGFVRSRADARVLHAALALILAGATGNLYDRVQFNAVRDMLHMLPDTRLWPWIFNIADASLMIGVGLLMIRIYRQDMSPQTAPEGRG